MAEKVDPGRFIRRTRFLQFRLRTLMFFMLACSFSLGLWTVYVQPFRSQKLALDELTGSGCVVRVQPADGPAWQRWLVTTILGESAFADAVLVDFQGADADENTLSSLRYLPRLQHLLADHVPITDAVIASLGACTELRELSLRYNSIGDEALVVIARMPALEKLYLTGTQVSDQGLGRLRDMPNLEEVFVRWTHVTAKGAAELQDARPDCKVHFHTTSM